MKPLHLQSLLGFFAQLVLFLILLNHSLLPALGLINCGSRLGPLLAPVPLATKITASKLICYFISHAAVFGLQSSTLSDNITLTSANGKADQSLSEFQAGICAAAHATLDTEQLISHLRVALDDTVSSLPNSERSYTCAPSTWITCQGSWHSGQWCVQMRWDLNSYFSLCLILLPDSIVRSWLHSSHFFMVSRMWFLLVRLACMAI